MKALPAQIARRRSARGAVVIQKTLGQNLDVLVVVDREHKLYGVVERDQILSKSMLALVARDEKR